MPLRTLTLVAAATALAAFAAPASAAPVPAYVATVNSVYVPGDVVITQGSALTLVNLENVAHDLVSSDVENGLPLFQARIAAGPGDTAPVVGVEKLGLGYHPFYCSLHEAMRGTIQVV